MSYDYKRQIDSASGNLLVKDIPSEAVGTKD